MGRVVVRRNFGSGAKLSKFAHSRQKAGALHDSAPVLRPPIDPTRRDTVLDDSARLAQLEMLDEVGYAWDEGFYAPNAFEEGFLTNIRKTLQFRPLTVAQETVLERILAKVEDMQDEPRTYRRRT